LAGNPINSDTIDVYTGWNLIGSIGLPVAADSITSEPPSIIASDIYGYNHGYKTAEFIYPTLGYWVKVKQNGKIILKPSGVK
jgi:hypothetical protein